MGYEHDMDDYYEEQHDLKSPLIEGSMQFRRKSLISCVGVSFRTLIFNYICWTLSGKPENWRIHGK